MRTRGGIVVALLMAWAAVVVSVTVPVPPPVGFDEQAYLFLTSRLAREGPIALPKLFEDHMAHLAERQYHPSPIRIVYLLLGSLAVRLGGPTLGSLQKLSLVAYLILLVCVFMGTRRLLGEKTALWTTLLMTTSPLYLAIARRALSDNVIALFMLICLWLFIHGLAREKRGPPYWAAVAIAYTLTFLTKGLTLILIPISLTMMVYWAFRKRRAFPVGPALSVSLIPLAAAVSLAILAAGEASFAWKAIATEVGMTRTNLYDLWYQSGPWYRYLIDYLLLSPWTTLFYLIGLGTVIGKRSCSEEVLAWLFLPFLFMAFAAPAIKNLRHALLFEAPLRLGAVLLLQHLIRPQAQKWFQPLLMSLVVFAILLSDLSVFRAVFVQRNVYDPISFNLLKSRGFLP